MFVMVLKISKTETVGIACLMNFLFLSDIIEIHELNSHICYIYEWTQILSTNTVNKFKQSQTLYSLV